MTPFVVYCYRAGIVFSITAAEISLCVFGNGLGYRKGSCRIKSENLKLNIKEATSILCIFSYKLP
jgi:hypothetical protein